MAIRDWYNSKSYWLGFFVGVGGMVVGTILAKVILR
jgi:hypothetical protein